MTTPAALTPPAAAAPAAAPAAAAAPSGSITLRYVELCKFRRLGKVQLDLDPQTKRQNLPFSVVDGSLKEAAPEPRWKEAALKEIRQCDVVVVLLGRYTHKAPGVLAEVAMARAEGKPIVQLVGSRHGGYTRVRGGGRILAWTQDNLTRLFGGL